MARIVASVNVSHVPAVGAAWDNKKSQDPYWKPLFDGFDFSKKWIADLKPDVILLVYNDHASAFDASIIPTFAIGCASTFVWAGLNTIAVESFPENRAGATSAYSAFKFAGVAIAPLVYVPLFHVDTRLPFVLAAAFSALLAVLILPWFRRYR